VADILTLKATEQEILIYSPELDLIVRQERAPAGARLSLDGAAVHGVRLYATGSNRCGNSFSHWARRPRNFSGDFSRRTPRTQAFTPATSCASKNAIIQMTSTERLARPVDITPKRASALDEELARAVKEASPPSELLERLPALEVGRSPNEGSNEVSAWNSMTPETPISFTK
jgi:hypothetical protein